MKGSIGSGFRWARHVFPGRKRVAQGRRGRWSRLARRALVATSMAYAMLQLFPGILFAHHTDRGRFHVSGDKPIAPEIARVLDDAAARLARSPLDDPDMDHHLYLCDSPARRALLAPQGWGAFGVTHRLLKSTILNRTDIPSDRIFRGDPGRGVRALSAVIAHERLHALMERRYGLLACLRMPDWKSEGYCEYVAGSPSFPVAEGRRLIREGRPDASPSFRYFKAYVMMKYLLDERRLTVDEALALPFDEAALFEEARGAVDRLAL